MKTENLSIRISKETKKTLDEAVSLFNKKNNTALTVNAYVNKILVEGLSVTPKE